jgi:hypothetical protein
MIIVDHPFFCGGFFDCVIRSEGAPIAAAFPEVPCASSQIARHPIVIGVHASTSEAYGFELTKTHERRPRP